MIYLIDTSTFRTMGSYYPERFPTYWNWFEGIVGEGKILSVREVGLELSGQGTAAHIRGWKSKNSDIFIHPNEAMGRFVAEIFKVPNPFRFNGAMKMTVS